MSKLTFRLSQLLTTGSWPSESGGNCILPNEAMELCNAFQEFYARTHQNRKLIWQTNKGHAGLYLPPLPPPLPPTRMWGNVATVPFRYAYNRTAGSFGRQIRAVFPPPLLFTDMFLAALLTSWLAVIYRFDANEVAWKSAVRVMD